MKGTPKKIKIETVNVEMTLREMEIISRALAGLRLSAKPSVGGDTDRAYMDFVGEYAEMELATEE